MIRPCLRLLLGESEAALCDSDVVCDALDSEHATCRMTLWLMRVILDMRIFLQLLRVRDDREHEE